MRLVLHLYPPVSSEVDCSGQWVYQTRLCTKATTFFQVFFSYFEISWNIMGILKGLEASLEVPMGMGEKMHFVKIELTLNFVIVSGIRKSKFHKNWYYQSVLAQKIFNSISRTLSRTRDNTASIMHSHLFQVFLSEGSSWGVNISV